MTHTDWVCRVARVLYLFYYFDMVATIVLLRVVVSDYTYQDIKDCGRILLGLRVRARCLLLAVSFCRVLQLIALRSSPRPRQCLLQLSRHCCCCFLCCQPCPAQLQLRQWLLLVRLLQRARGKRVGWIRAGVREDLVKFGQRL